MTWTNSRSIDATNGTDQPEVSDACRELMIEERRDGCDEHLEPSIALNIFDAGDTRTLRTATRPYWRRMLFIPNGCIPARFDDVATLVSTTSKTERSRLTGTAEY